MGKKKLFIIIPVTIIAIVLLIVLGALFFNKNKKTITSDVELNEIKITNITINYENHTSLYRAKVTAKQDIQMNYILIQATDKDGKTVDLVGYVDKELKKGETIDIVCAIDIDITGYKKIKYEIK